MKSTALLMVLLFVTTPSFADMIKLKSGYNSDGDKRYLTWNSINELTLELKGYDPKKISMFFHDYCVTNPNYRTAEVIKMKTDGEDAIIIVNSSWMIGSTRSKILVTPRKLKCLSIDL